MDREQQRKELTESWKREHRKRKKKRRVPCLLVENHFADRHFADRHFADRHFGRQTFWLTDILADWHLADRHFGRQTFGRQTFGRQTFWPTDSDTLSWYQHHYTIFILYMCRPNASRSSGFRPKGREPKCEAIILMYSSERCQGKKDDTMTQMKKKTLKTFYFGVSMRLRGYNELCWMPSMHRYPWKKIAETRFIGKKSF